jgi:hypothetical protein
MEGWYSKLSESRDCSYSGQSSTPPSEQVLSILYSGLIERKKGWGCVDPTTNKAYVSPHVVFYETSSWWYIENVVLPDSESLYTSMRAQLPERQELSVGSDSGPVTQIEFTNWPLSPI